VGAETCGGTGRRLRRSWGKQPGQQPYLGLIADRRGPGAEPVGYQFAGDILWLIALRKEKLDATFGCLPVAILLSLGGAILMQWLLPI
jgi:hypothetical protein